MSKHGPAPSTVGAPTGTTRAIAEALATWFGCGRSPFAPGTVGSLGALLPLLPLLSTEPVWWRMLLIVLVAVFLIPGIWSATAYEKITGRADPQPVVIDEVLGQWITLAFATKLSWMSFGLAFLLFRAFDIVKPFPVRQAESLPTGTGIVMDDVVAGLYAGLVLYAAGCFNFY